MEAQAQAQAAPQPTTKVLVSNISPSANEKTIAGFFSFCGTIINIKLNSYPDAAGEAVVEFDSEAAAKTALLLTNAVIADRPITVTPYGASSFGGNPGAQSSELSGADIPNRNNLPADQRSQTSVVASMLAAGYTLGSDALQQARAYDEQNHISQRLQAAATVARDKIYEIDQNWKISENANNLASAVATKSREVDETWHISQTASSIFSNITATVEAVAAKAKENPTVQGAVATLSTTAENISNYIAPTAEAVKSNVESIKDQTNQNIEERQRLRSNSKENAVPSATPASNPQ